MPQLNKGGKYVFGWSLIREDGSIHFPPMAICEYDLAADDRIIIFTGSRITGGFCVTNSRMLSSSKLKHILTDLPELDGSCPDSGGQFIRYKGRYYSWLHLSGDGCVRIPSSALDFLSLKTGDRLMAIRSSDIAFTMGARGPLIEKGVNYPGEIEVF